MVSKNNIQVKDRYATKQVSHYGIRKLSVGVASILLGTTFYLGMNGNVVHADTANGQDSETSNSQIANNNDNSKSNSTADSGANAALGNKQASEKAVKREINTKPQVTEITTNGSPVQSDATNVKPDADVQNEVNNGSHVQSDATNAKSDADVQNEVNAKPQGTEITNDRPVQSDAANTESNADVQDRKSVV